MSVGLTVAGLIRMMSGYPSWVGVLHHISPSLTRLKTLLTLMKLSCKIWIIEQPALVPSLVLAKTHKKVKILCQSAASLHLFKALISFKGKRINRKYLWEKLLLRRKPRSKVFHLKIFLSMVKMFSDLKKKAQRTLKAMNLPTLSKRISDSHWRRLFWVMSSALTTFSKKCAIFCQAESSSDSTLLASLLKILPQSTWVT